MKHESLVNKVKEGDSVIFNVGDNRHYGDWGMESEDAMAPIIDHDGQTAIVTSVAIDDGDSASQVVDGPFYVDIKFEDGFELQAVDGYNLTPVRSQQRPGRTGAPVGPGATTPHGAPPSSRFTPQGRRPARHDFIPSASSESLEKQAKNLVQTVLNKVREGVDDADWEEPGGPSDSQVRANDADHRERMAGGKRPPHRAPGRPPMPGENPSARDPDYAPVQDVLIKVSEWHAGQIQDLINGLSSLYENPDQLPNMDAQQIEFHLKAAARILGERSGD